MLLEAYEADKAWSAKGAARVERPPALRAGRVVVELWDKEVRRCVKSWHGVVWHGMAWDGMARCRAQLPAAGRASWAAGRA